LARNVLPVAGHFLAEARQTIIRNVPCETAITVQKHRG